MNGGPWWAFWLLIVGLCLAMLGIYGFIQSRRKRATDNDAQIVCLRCGARVTAAEATPSVIASLCQIMEDHQRVCMSEATMIEVPDV